MARKHKWKEGEQENKTAMWFILFGIALIFVGLFMTFGMPLNKPIWSTSYAVFMSGCAGFLKFQTAKQDY